MKHGRVLRQREQLVRKRAHSCPCACFVQLPFFVRTNILHLLVRPIQKWHLEAARERSNSAIANSKATSCISFCQTKKMRQSARVARSIIRGCWRIAGLGQLSASGQRAFPSQTIMKIAGPITNAMAHLGSSIPQRQMVIIDTVFHHGFPVNGVQPPQFQPHDRAAVPLRPGI